MEIKEERIDRTFVFTQKELKEKLKIKGDIREMELEESLSPKEEEKGISRDKDKWAIYTEEKIK